MRIKGAALLAAAALTLTACGGSSDEPADKAAAKVSIAWGKADLAQQLRDQVGLPESTKVSCKAGLPADEGAKTTCTATAEGESAKYDVVVEPAGETGAMAPVFTGEGGAPANEEDYPAEEDPVEEEPDTMYAYGETANGEEQNITITAPKKVQVSSDDASMCEMDEGPQPKAFLQVVLTSKNTSSAPLDMASSLMIAGTSGTRTACDVDAMGDEQMATILPGKTGKATLRFGVQDTSEPLTIEVSEASGMGSIYFTNDPSAS